MGDVTIEAISGDDLRTVLPTLAQLRITVFRDFPYLYDGNLEYEQRYLDAFSRAQGAIVVIAKDDDQIVGASTGAPLGEVEEDWQKPFRVRGDDLDTIFYCAESVLLEPYRGRGLGHAFFDQREAHARALGAVKSCFCSVLRPVDHPARPAGYAGHDIFWGKRGYAPLDGVTARFAWTDLGDAAETDKTLQFWGRDL